MPKPTISILTAPNSQRVMLFLDKEQRVIHVDTSFDAFEAPSKSVVQEGVLCLDKGDARALGSALMSLASKLG